MPQKTQTKPTLKTDLKNHWSDDHLLEASNVLELRAARGYSHFLVSHQRQDEARDVLAPILGWLQEGRNALDYVYADALFKTL